MNRLAKSFEDQLLETEEGREFLSELKSRIATNFSKTFFKALDEFEHFSPEDLVANHGVSMPSVTDESAEILKRISVEISAAKEELRSISDMAEERRYSSYNTKVGDELTAIIHDTANATTEIMNSVDTIEEHLKGVLEINPDLSGVIELIKGKCIDITLACSFQDITSQRVQKVVGVIEAIDGQMAAAKSQLHNEVEDFVMPQEEDWSADTQKKYGLLDGPAHPWAATDQEAIDKLFEEGEE